VKPFLLDTMVWWFSSKRRGAGSVSLQERHDARQGNASGMTAFLTLEMPRAMIVLCRVACTFRWNIK
jgi:hypothetical protein